MFKFAKIICFCLIAIIADSALAAQLPSNITPQQIEQFKRLSPAQQRSLAQSMGIDYSVIQSQLKSNKGQKNSKGEMPQQYFPRGTQLDEYGNPLFDEQAMLNEKEKEEDEKELKPFGYEVFSNAPLTFAPSIDIAIPGDYIIGAGDVIKVQVFGTENNEYELEVSRDGNIIVPSIGAYTVGGLTFSEI